MRIKAFKDANDFIKATEDLLLQNESFYNLKLGLSIGIQKNTIQISAPYILRYLIISLLLVALYELK